MERTRGVKLFWMTGSLPGETKKHLPDLIICDIQMLLAAESN
jgi:hypothetical protein